MKKKHIGSNFDDFLEADGTLEEATAVAVKRIIAWQIRQEMKVQNLTKTELASKMRTSHASLNRLLDEDRYQPDPEHFGQRCIGTGGKSLYQLGLIR
jgi:hypothetical protein